MQGLRELQQKQRRTRISAALSAKEAVDVVCTPVIRLDTSTGAPVSMAE